MHADTYLTLLAAAAGNPKTTFLFVFLSFFIVLAFSFLKVQYAWGGIFMAVIGFIAMRKAHGEPQADCTAESKENKAFKIHLNGPISIFMIVSGTIISTADITLNGKPLLVDAKIMASSLSNHPFDPNTAAQKASDRIEKEETIYVNKAEFKRFARFYSKGLDFFPSEFPGYIPTPECKRCFANYEAQVDLLEEAHEYPASVDALLLSLENLQSSLKQAHEGGQNCKLIIDRSKRIEWLCLTYKHGSESNIPAAKQNILMDPASD